jgi:hypothetical protein
VARYTSPIVTWVLMIAGFALALDAVTAWWARAGSTGGMRDYRQ